MPPHTSVNLALAEHAASSVRRAWSQWPWVLITLIVACLVLLPIVPLELLAFSNGSQGFRDLVSHPRVAEVFTTTLQLSLGAAGFAIVLGTALAFAIDSMPPHLRQYFSFFPVLPIIIPGIAHVVGFVFLFSPENGYINTMLRATPFFSGRTGPIDVYTPIWIIIFTGINLASFVFLFVYTGLQNLGSDYSQAARVNGASGFRSFFTVSLPLLRPVLIYSSVVVFMLGLGQLIGPLILGRRRGVNVITTDMFVTLEYYPINYGLVAALGSPLLAVGLILVVIQRGLLKNQNRFVGRGDMSTQAPFTGSRLSLSLSIMFVGVFALFSALLPLIALIFVSLSSFWTGSLSLTNMTTRHLLNATADPALLRSVLTSLEVTAYAILLVIPFGMMIALTLYNRERVWTPIAIALDVLTNLPLSVPAALIGFGFLFAYGLPWIGLAGTKLGLTLAYVTIMLPYAVRYQLAALVALGNTTIDASRVAGASSLRSFFEIILPLSKRNIAAAAAIIFILLSHEFGVSVLLRGPTTTVMSVHLYEEFRSGLYPRVAVIALVMTVITSLGVAVALMVAGRKAFARL